MSKRDLLRKLRSVRSTERGIVPDQAWVSRTRLELMQKVRQADALAPLPASLRWREAARTFAPAKLASLMRAPALAALSVIGAVLGGSLMGVNASERSVPGDFLYPIKLASEQTRLALTSDKAERVRLKTEFVDRRVEEIKTIVKAPEQNPTRVREAAMVLKRDLDTVKNQLKEVKDEASTSKTKTVELAKLVDEKTVEITEELDQVKTEVPQEVKPALAEAQAQAVQTGVAAVAVLIEAKDQPQEGDNQITVTDAEVAQTLQNKVDGLQASIEDSASRVQAASASGTATSLSSTTTPQIATASSTLSEVKVLIGENKLGQATNKLAEAAKATIQAEVATDLFVASSTAAVAPGTSQPLPTTTSSTTASSTTQVPSTSSTPSIPPSTTSTR